MKKTIVSSWNEWDPLKHVIVGKADNCCIPAPEPAGAGAGIQQLSALPTMTCLRG